MCVLDGGHRVVDQLADGRLLGVGLEVRPARLLRHPEHVLGEVFVRVFGSGGVLGQQRRALGLEGVRDVLEEDQAERDVLVVGRLQVLAQLVGGQEQLRLEAEIGAVAVHGFGFRFFRSSPCHPSSLSLNAVLSWLSLRSSPTPVTAPCFPAWHHCTA